jgi:hypothetical protein
MEKTPGGESGQLCRSPKRDLDKRITIQWRLMRAEILGGQFENVCEVEFRC